MAKKSKDFFKSAGVKLNREIKAEQKAQAHSKQSGFVNQLNQHKSRDSKVYNQAKAQGQTYNLFKGQDVITKDKRPVPEFEQKFDKLNPVTDTNESPQGNFQLEQRLNLFRKGIK